MALFSATMPKAILDITDTYQKNAVYVKVMPKEITVAAIKQAYYRVAKKDKSEAICRLLDYYQPARSLIFCNTKRMVDDITGYLKDKGYEAEGLHGDLSQNKRDTVMNLFRNGRCRILIATDVAARGIDVSGVDAVFNYDVPDDIEYYVHRIGRTGRAGRKGRAFTLISGREIFKIRDIEKVCHTTIKERRIPTPADITRIKSGNLFAQAMEIMEQKDLSELQKVIQKAAEENGFDILDLAAAFMQMSMGDEPEEIKEEKKEIDKVGSQIDVLPTILNLFGIDYDSRLIIGKDILSENEGLAILSNSSWVSDYGTYNSSTRVFTPKEGKELVGETQEEYIKRINNKVANNFTISKLIIDNDYYTYILGS